MWAWPKPCSIARYLYVPFHGGSPCLYLNRTQLATLKAWHCAWAVLSSCVALSVLLSLALSHWPADSINQSLVCFEIGEQCNVFWFCHLNWNEEMRRVDYSQHGKLLSSTYCSSLQSHENRSFCISRYKKERIVNDNMRCHLSIVLFAVAKCSC